jgi:hypothetical protein
MNKKPNITEGVQTAIALPEAIDLIRFEKNLLQIGFFSAHDKRSSSPDLSRRIEQVVNREGKKIKVSAEFRSTLGLPSTADRDKYKFSGYSMLKALGVSDSGANYEDLNEWGMRMADTTITSEQIIYSSSRRKFMNKTVHVFRSFTRVGESDHDGSNQSVQFAVELEDWLLENLNQSYVVPEDFTQYRKLVRPTAKGIFVYLYVWFFASRGKEVEKDYGELCALLNVRCYQHASKIRETMGLSLDDLVQIGYLRKWDIRPMSTKKGFKLVLTPGKAILDVIASTQRRQIESGATDSELLSPAEERVRQALVNRGVDEDKAVEMVRSCDLDSVEDQLEYLDCEIERDAGRRLKNPAGFIIAFIENRKPIPASFESRSRREARLRAEAAERARKDEQLAAEVEQLESLQRYEDWRLEQAQKIIAAYPASELESQLKAVRLKLCKDRRFTSFLDRLTAVERRNELVRQLRRQLAEELSLSSYDEWCSEQGQQCLFN